MKEKPVLPLLVSMALPNVISMLVNSLYNIVDSLFVARISEDAMTALSLVFPIQNFANAIAIGFGIGINAMIALYLGAGDRKKAETAATHGMALSLMHGILITIVSIVIMPGFLRRFTSDAGLIASGITYSTIVFLFATINMAALAFEKMFQAVGRMKVTMVALIFGCVCNILLDPILIFGLGPVPAMGIAGAALATVLAQAVSVVFALCILAKKKLPFTITKADFRLNTQCRKFLSIGLPLALQECLTQISFLALCAFVNRLGLTASSGYGVACKIVSFAMLIPSALMQSMASFVAQNVGAGNPKRARQSMLTGIGIGLVFGCFVFALVLLKGDLLTGIFSTDAEVVQNGFAYLKGFAPETILTAVLFSMIGYFNGNNQTLWVMIQGLTQTLLVRLPLAYFMSIQPDASLTKIGLAAPVSTAVGIVLNILFFICFQRKLAKGKREA